jgi:hypothetical protein
MTNEIKAAGWTFLFSFIALFGTAALGWLQEVIEWASTSGETPLPGLSTIGYAAVSAVAAAAIGLVNFVVRFAQAKGVIPGETPTYTD